MGTKHDMAEQKFGGKVAVLSGVKQIEIKTSPLPTPASDEVLIQVASVGICGSDMSYYFKGQIGGRTIPFPDVLETRFAGVMGHEAAGVVAGVGSGVAGLQVGDRVALEPGYPCGHCTQCRTGRYNLCPSVKFLGSFLSDYSGALCEYMCHPASMCFKLPSHVSLDEGALMEPLAVGLQAAKRGRVTMSDKVLISGAGPVGLLSLVSCLSLGAREIHITDISPKRLELAASLGAHRTFLLPDKQHELHNDYTVCIECSGVGSAVEACITHAGRAGRVVLVGMGDMNVPLRQVQLKELDVMGVFRYCNVYPDALQVVASGKFNLKQMITHRFSLEQTNEAFTAARDDPTAVKVVIQPNAQ
eukprot:c17868_g1_i1.p1 GENE.c17868_g1_i1~~c17868_g1_i1.p1  ORF type:complete len:359 (-),score=85.77 c17868_g1_i1:76-1152(-)